MRLNEFEEWLTLCDRGEKKLHRKQIFTTYGLPIDELQELYRNLCRYIHISRKSFDAGQTWPNIQYIPEKFDEIFTLTRKTTDLCLSLECMMLLQFDEGTKGALKGFRQSLGGLTSSIPMTAKLLSNMGKSNS